MVLMFLVKVEWPNGEVEQKYVPANLALVDNETSLGDTAVLEARKAYPGTLCWLQLDNCGKKVRQIK